MADSQPTLSLPSFPDLPGVRFALVPDWPGYAASDDGRIWSCHSTARTANGTITHEIGEWREMAMQLSDKGYYVAYLYCNRKRRRARVHVLVLEAFVGICPPGMEGCHDPDPTRTNNRLSNLRWDTRKSNHADKIKHGTSNRGQRHGMAKLTEAAVVEITSGSLAGLSNSQAANALGVSSAAVRFVRKGETWSHVTGISPGSDCKGKRSSQAK